MKGIDISQHNGNIDFNKVKNEVDFAILRLGYIGNNEVKLDSKFEEYYNACITVGLPVGIYVFNYAKSVERAKIGARWTVEMLKNKNINMPVYIDMEDDRNNLHSMGRNALTDICIAFNDIIESNGYRAGVYANADWFRNYLDKDRLSKYSLWIAHYGVNEDKYISQYDMLQYTDTGRINGINANTDINKLYNNSIINGNLPKENNVVAEGIIATVQNTLNQRYGLNINVDNIYGKQTKKALVVGLQTELNNQYNKGLKVDGIFGNKTKNACINIKRGARGNISWLIQAMLYCQGFNPKGLDGIFGYGTEASVVQFQGLHGLSTDGIVGKETFEKMFC